MFKSVARVVTEHFQNQLPSKIIENDEISCVLPNLTGGQDKYSIRYLR